MGLDVALESENSCQAGPKPKTVTPSLRNIPKVEERNKKGRPTSRNYHLKSSDIDLREACLINSPSPRRKSMPSRHVEVNVKDHEVLKRGSVYQSSREIRRMRKHREGRRKTEPAYSDEAYLSFEIIDSLSRPSHNEASLCSLQRRSKLVSLNAELKSASVDTNQSIPTKSMELLDLSFRHLPEAHSNIKSSSSGFITTRDSSADNLLEICLHSGDTKFQSAKVAPELVERGLVEEPKSKCNRMLYPQNDNLCERDTVYTLPKSLSAKVGVSNSPRVSEGNLSNASPKTRFSPLKKMLDPIMKSKSQRNPSLKIPEEPTTIDPASIRRNRVICKSVLDDLSKATKKVEYDGRLIGKDQGSTTGSSPAHLHGTLKLECIHGVPSFEFSIKDPEDVLCAQTWRTDNAFNWVYTFHSCKKKSNGAGWGTKDRHRKSTPMVGQMQVSCYLCSEVSDNGSLDNSMVTEFILYDIAHARRSFTVEERSFRSSDSTRPPNVTIVDGETEKYQQPVRRASSDCDSDASTSSPWAPEDLHPHLEIAAIVSQIPFLRKERSKDLQDEIGAKKLKKISALDQGRDSIPNSLNPAIVKVVTPSGTHGSPCSEESSPSSLLSRWKSGGGCDCGGWDMACPIVVFDNPRDENEADYSTLGSPRPMVLFAQGRKEKIPALSITAEEKGQYSVDFHAQLSALQAFSICIAILHSAEDSWVVGQENRQRLQSNSLKLLLEEEVRHLIEAVAEEEKRKAKKKVEKISPSFLLDPPFSPMGRV